jgi:hypothetical protein
MRVQILDTSALTDLVAPGSALVRHQLLDEVDAERIVVLVTHPLIWEVSATRAVNEEKYRAMVELLARSSRGRVLLRLPLRRERELRARRALEFPEFIDSEMQFVPLFDAKAVDGIAAHGAGVARGLRFAEAEKALETVQALDAEERRQRSAQGAPLDGSGTGWRKALKHANRDKNYLLKFAESFARDAVTESGKRFGVDASPLHPRSLPTFWSSALIHVARIRAVVVAGTSPNGRRSANQMDLLHLKEAATYADSFVCSDVPLREFAKGVPDLGCEVVAFDEWATRLTR